MGVQLVHLGDAHFGPQGGRNADRYAALDQILRDAEGLPRLGAWLWPGDLNHSRMTIEDRNALAARLVQMARRAPVVLCYGNHDLPGDLDIFAHLHAAHPIYVVDRPAVLSVRLATGAMAAIAVLPYPTRAGLIAAGTGASQTLEAGREALTAIVRGLAAELDVARANGQVVLTIGHVNVAGAIASTGQPQIGQEIELDPAAVGELARRGYVGLNHIHRPQSIHGAYYAGSITPMDWGEIEPKRYLVIEITGAEAVVRSCPIATPAMYHVEGELTREGFTWRVTRGLGGAPAAAPETFAGADVRVRYTYRVAERDVLDVRQVAAPFAGARRLKLDPVPLADRAIRAPQVAAARTLEEKIRAYCAQEGLPVTEGLLAKVAALTAPGSEEVPA